MDIKVVIRGVDEAGQLRDYAEERLGHALERFEHQVLSATMRLEDETGPEKHGVDKHCNVDVRLRTGEVVIKEQGEDFLAVVNVAMDRLRAVLGREVAKAKRGIGEG